MKVDKYMSVKHQILLIRSHKCRKSDIIERFLKNAGLPYSVKYLDDPDVKKLIEKFGIKASPGIIIGRQSINPYDVIEKCTIKNPEQLERHLRELLHKE